MSELPEVIQALLSPEIYPDTTKQVSMMQTQMSFILLAGDYVYKVKKPVNLGYLDYSTLDKRLFYCQREVELNRRLCPDAYLGVVPIARDGAVVSLGEKGEVVEYAVKMRYLPQEAMMNVLLTGGKVSAEMVTRVAQKLGEFHRKAATNATISTFGDLDTITTNTNENFSQTEKYIGKTISEQKYRHIRNYAETFIRENTPLFHKRINDGKIRDCHGDLHAAHVCFADSICIYDCIEFNDRFRYCDIASEIAFLAMDLDHYGRADLSRAFVNAYIALSEDSELSKLLSFYKCYRAYVRGKVEGFKLDDPYITEGDKRQTRQVASSYFDLAYAYTRLRPVLFITTGLVGTGKTALAQALAKRLGLVVISSDVTRKRLASIPPTEHHFEEFSAGIYSPEFTRLTYDTILNEAKGVLAERGPVIIDASFIKAKERLKAGELAEEMGADFFILECTLDDQTIKQRLAQRLEQGSVSDGRWELLEPQKRQFDPITEIPEANHIVVDTSAPVDDIVQKVLDRIT